MKTGTLAILISNLHGGGAERVSVNLANSFIHRDYSVDMVLMSATGVFLADLLPDVRVIDLNVSRIRSLLLPLIHYLRQEKPAVLLACVWPLTAIAILACRLAGVPTRVVVSEHTTWSRSELLTNRFKRWQVSASMHYLFPKANGVVTVSQGASDDLRCFANLKTNLVQTIYNPVVSSNQLKNDNTVPRHPLEWWEGAHPKLLAVGTLKSIKDYPTLLSAFACLRQNSDAKLLILGEGECRSALELQARQLGLDGSLFMPGFVDDPLPYFQQADLHILSSLAEGLPTVIIEALASETPVVSTDCPSGPAEILNHGQFGRLVPVGDVDSLTTAIRQSLNETPDREALKARAQAFSIDKATDQYEALLFGERV
jgi:glycosyltransferase involved in cell wall biosynthesis